MGMGYKALSLLKSLASMSANGDAGCNLVSYGYQYITLTVEQLHDLVGEDNTYKVFIRYDCYGTQQEVVKAMPFSEFKEQVFTGKVYKNLDLDDTRQVLRLFKQKTPKILRRWLKFDPASVLNVNMLKAQGIHNIELLIQNLKKNEFVFETTSIFSYFNIKPTVIDIIRNAQTEVVHDLNTPVDESLHGKFDIVLDAGTLEHCFNVPQVLANSVNMTKVGGYVYHIVPMTWPNHGFYNFNPCLFHEFYETNGFKTNCVLAGLNYTDEPFYEMPVHDAFALPPESTLLIYTAKKEKNVPEIVWPIQSIYNS